MKSGIFHTSRFFKIWTSTVTLALLLCASAAIGAEEPSSSARRVSFGVGALAGTYDVANAGDGPGAITDSDHVASTESSLVLRVRGVDRERCLA